MDDDNGEHRAAAPCSRDAVVGAQQAEPSAGLARPEPLGCRGNPSLGVSSRRKSRKTELDELREHVKELETQLASLKAHKDDKSDGRWVRLQSLDVAPASSSAALWERTARAQRDQRVRAEAENARLREVVEGQLKVAASLEKLLRKRSSHEVRARRRLHLSLVLPLSNECTSAGAWTAQLGGKAVRGI
jgi:hypothetical protein